MIEDLLEAPFNEPIFGTCGEIAAIKAIEWNKKSIALLGGSDATIKMIDMSSGETVTDCVIKILDDEVEIIDFGIYKDNIIFSTKDGKVCAIKLPLDEKSHFDLATVKIIFSNSSTLRCFYIYEDYIFVGTLSGSIKCLSLESLESKDFPVVANFNLEKSSGFIKMLSVIEKNNTPTIIISTGSGTVVNLRLDGKNFKLVKIVKNLVTKDKETELSGLRRSNILHSTEFNSLYFVENNKIHRMSIDNWNVERSILQINTRILNIEIDPVKRCIFCSDDQKNVLIFSLDSKKQLIVFKGEELITKMESFKETPVALLETGDFYVLKGIYSKIPDLVVSTSSSELDNRINDKEVFHEKDSVMDVSIEQQKEEFRKEVNEALLENEQLENDAAPMITDSVDINGIVDKVTNKILFQKSPVNTEVFPPTNTFLSHFDKLACFLFVSNCGKLIRKQNEIELSFFSVSKKPIKINTYELGRKFSLGAFNENGIIICSQLSNNDEVLLRNPYKRPLLDSKSLKKDTNASKSILERAFQDVESLERNSKQLSEEEKLIKEQQNTAIIHFKPTCFNNIHTEWSLEFKSKTDTCVGESPVLLGCGSDFMVVVTDILNLRIIRFNSLQEPVLKLSEPVISLAAYSDMILLIQKNGSFDLLQVGPESRGLSTVTSLQRGKLPLNANGYELNTIWTGFSKEGLPFIVDKSKRCFVLMRQHQHWAKVADISENCWPFSISKDCILSYTLPPGKEVPSVADKLAVDKVQLKFDLLGLTAKVGAMKHKLEDKALLMSQLELYKDVDEVDSLLYKHIMLSTKLQKWNRVEGLLRRIATDYIAQKALNFVKKNCSAPSVVRELEILVSSREIPLNAQKLTESPTVNPSFQAAVVSTQNKRVVAERQVEDFSPKLSRKSTISKEARLSSSKKQRLF